MSKLGKKSICGKCEWYKSTYNGIHWCCAFFPSPPFSGIPEKYITGEAEHKQVDEGQSSDFVFKEKEIYPIL